jgi:hypothetical protein
MTMGTTIAIVAGVIAITLLLFGLSGLRNVY